MKLALKLSGFRTIPADSEVHVKGREIRTVLVAIDVGISELLLARELGCDAVIAHHPVGGKARIDGYRVFQRHIEQMVEAGVPKNVAIEAVEKKFQALEVQHHSDNYDQTVSAAKIMKIPLLSIHSPCDEIGRKTIVSTIKTLNHNATVGQLVSRINHLSEFRKAKTKIKVRIGSAKNKAGKVAFSHAAYTNGGYDVARTYYDYGTDTLAYIHISDGDLSKLASERHGNLIILGHIASDWLGINLLLREMQYLGVKAVRTTELEPLRTD